MESNKSIFKGRFVWIGQVFIQQLALQVLWCSGHGIPEGVGGTFDLEYNEIDHNHIDPLDSSEMYKFSGHQKHHVNDRDYFMRYNIQDPHDIYEKKEIQLFKRSPKGDNAREKLRKMIKRNRIFHKGRVVNKNRSTLENKNISVEQSKKFNKGSSYKEGGHIYEKDNKNNKYAKSSSEREDKLYIMNNGDTLTKDDIDFTASNTSNGNDPVLKLDRSLRLDDRISPKSINISEKSKNSSYNFIDKEINLKKENNKKGSFEKKKLSCSKNRESKLKNGVMSPINKLIRRKLKSKMHKTPEITNHENMNEAKDSYHVADAKPITRIKKVKSKIKPGEVLSYGLEGNLKNLSLINHGFLKAFEKKYYDSHLNETAPEKFLKTKPTDTLGAGYDNYTGFEYTSKDLSKINEWKAWDGFNVGDYYEPLIYFNDKERFEGKSLNNIPQKAVHAHESRKDISVKEIATKDIETQHKIHQEESGKEISKTNLDKNSHDKKKRYMLSGKAKHKLHHAKTVENGKKRSARDTNNGIHSNNIYSSRRLHNGNEGFDYEETQDLDDQIYNKYNDIETPGLVLEVPRQKNNHRQTFQRLKKDDGYLKRSRTNKLKHKVEHVEFPNGNQFRKSNSRKVHESSYNGDERESTDTCVGYKCDEISNTTDTSTTATITDSNVSTKRSNNGKSKPFAKSKKVIGETKNTTNHTSELDEHSLFLCGQLADDFVNAIFTKVKRSRKILKELGFGNDTEQSCDRCIETKENKLPDIEVVRGTLGKCSTQSDSKHKNSKCYTVPDPMESFILLLLSFGSQEEDSMHNRFRDDNSFIFNGDDFESLTKKENNAAVNDKYFEGRESLNQDTFGKQHLSEEGDEEKTDKGSKGRHNSLEENNLGDSSKDSQEVYQSNDEELESKTKPLKNVETNGLQQELGEQQPFQSEENLKGNDLIDVFEGQDSLASARHKYQAYKEFKKENEIQNIKNNKLKIMPQDSDIDYTNEEILNAVPNSHNFERKHTNYLKNDPSKAIFEQAKQNMQLNDMLGNTRLQAYQKGDRQGLALNVDPQKIDINPFETRSGFLGNEVNRYDNTNKYIPNPQSRSIQSKIISQNSNMYVDEPLTGSAVGNNMEYQLFPDQLTAGGHDHSYNAMPLYTNDQRMDKRAIPSDTNEEEVIFFELPDIEYDLY